MNSIIFSLDTDHSLFCTMFTSLGSLVDKLAALEVGEDMTITKKADGFFEVIIDAPQVSSDGNNKLLSSDVHGDSGSNNSPTISIPMPRMTRTPFIPATVTSRMTRANAIKKEKASEKEEKQPKKKPPKMEQPKKALVIEYDDDDDYYEDADFSQQVQF